MPQGEVVSSLGLVVAVYTSLQNNTAEKVLGAVEIQSQCKADLKSSLAARTDTV